MRMRRGRALPVELMAAASLAAWLACVPSASAEEPSQQEAAKRQLETALQTSKKTGEIRSAARQLVVILRQQKALGPFLAQAQQELAQKPNDPAAQWKVIEGCLASGRRQEAIAKLRVLLVEAPRDEYLRARIAQAYAGDGQLEKGLAVLQEGLDAQPGSARLAEAVADVYARANRPQEAIERYRVLLAKSTDEPRQAFYRSRIEQITKSSAKPASSR